MTGFFIGLGLGLLLCIYVCRRWAASEEECFTQYRRLEREYDSLSTWNGELADMCDSLRNQINAGNRFEV